MNNTIISICREYCSGGKEIGKKVSDELGYTFLDKQLITEAAKKSGYDESVFEKVDEVATNSLLYSLVLGYDGEEWLQDAVLVGAVNIFSDVCVKERLFDRGSRCVKECILQNRKCHV